MIGGGLVAGRLGQATLDRARDLLGDVPRLRLAPRPRELALVGAALAGPSPSAATFAMDLGQSSLKRAVARIGDGDTVGLDRLPTLDVDRTLDGLGIVRLLADGVEPFEGEAVRIALCSYVEASGNPVAQGFVGQLRALTGDVPGFLARSVSARLGRPVGVSLLHDGSAAAHCLRGAPDAAVLMLGTSIGVGAPPCGRGRPPS